MADLSRRARDVQGVQVTAAVITLAALSLALGVGLVLALRWGITAKDEANAAGDLLRGTKELVSQQAIDIQSLKQQLAQAKTLAAIAQKQRNDATSAATKATVEKIKAATPKEAAKLINETSPVVDIRTGGPITELK